LEPARSGRLQTTVRLTATDRRIVRLAIPALGSLAVEPLYVLVDTAIVGRLGTAQLGGLALAASVLSLVTAGCNFLTYGTTERVARRRGAGDATAAAEVGVQAVWLSALVAAVVVPVIVLGATTLGRLLGGEGDVLDFGVTYLRISAAGVPFVVLALAAQGVLRGVLDYRTPLVILLFSNLLNVALEVWFVYGLDLGVPGSAWSTVIAQLVAGVAFALAIRPYLSGAAERRPSWTGMSPLLTAGRHLLLRVGSMLAVLTGATAIAARVDEPTLAAHQIAASLFFFLALALDALAIPAQTLVADELGRGSTTGAGIVSARTARLSLYAGLGLALLVAAAAPLLPHAFTGDAAVIDRATDALWWLAALLVPGAIAFAYDGVLIGAADYRFLGLAALGYLLAIAPFGLAVLGLDLGIAGIWAALTLWMAMRAIVNHKRSTHVLAAPTSLAFLPSDRPLEGPI
jgi:putative MATE family efflux protein